MKETNKAVVRRMFLLTCVLSCIFALYLNKDHQISAFTEIQPSFRKFSNKKHSKDGESENDMELLLSSERLTNFSGKAVYSSTKAYHTSKRKLFNRMFPLKSDIDSTNISNRELTFDKNVYDIMNMEPIQFDPAFKNPCFNGSDHSSPIKDSRLHCLPYFYLIGVKKSGTSDLFSRIKAHPEMCRPSFNKESQWFARVRFTNKDYAMTTRKAQFRGIDPRKIEYFISLFDRAASCIYRNPSRDDNGSVYYKRITAEASPSTFHMQSMWEMLPGNENFSEPRYTHFNYIRHITPNAKIIILFRDPTSRLYSDFQFTNRGKYGNFSRVVFHEHVVALIEAYQNCFNQFSQRSCVYSNTLKSASGLVEKNIRLAGSFNAGFYAVFMRDLLDVFGRSQLLPILMKDYVISMKETLEKVFKFLEMTPVNSAKMKLILKSEKERVSGRKKMAGPMLEKTKCLLDDFYRPYNKDMAKLMKDKRYLFLE